MASVSLCAVGLALPASKLYRCKEPAISALCFPKRRFGGFAMTEDRVPRHCRLSCFSGNESNSMTAPIVEKGDNDNDVPVPKVAIDQDSDPNATVVEITFGDRLGTLIDTMEALRDLGLNVVKAKVNLDSSGKHNTFCITRADTGRKVDDPELLEAIRLTIINNLLTYHPESSTKLAMGEAFGIMPPKERVDVDIATHIYIYDDGPKRSLLYIETADRPGLLVEIVKQLLDISISVESGEFDTEGLLAKAKFHVSYQGAALIKPMQEVLANSLRYYLRIPATQESSF